MIDLQIPYWVINVCGGWLLGVASIVGLSAWLNWRKRRRVLAALGAIAVEFETEEGESDATND